MEDVLPLVSVRSSMAGLLALLVPLACAGPVAGAPPAAPAPSKVVRVTLLLFSGRSDPTFEIEPAIAAERLLPGLRATRAIETAPGETVIPMTLGYGGIVVQNLAGVPGLPGTMIVYRNRIEVRDGKVSIRLGEGRDLEEALVKLALERRAIDESLLQWIQRM